MQVQDLRCQIHTWIEAYILDKNDIAKSQGQWRCEGHEQVGVYKNGSTWLGLEDIKLCEISTIFENRVRVDTCWGQCLMSPCWCSVWGFIRFWSMGLVRHRWMLRVRQCPKCLRLVRNSRRVVQDITLDHEWLCTYLVKKSSHGIPTDSATCPSVMFTQSSQSPC